jgi:hypothetical protein
MVGREAEDLRILRIAIKSTTKASKRLTALTSMKAAIFQRITSVVDSSHIANHG